MLPKQAIDLSELKKKQSCKGKEFLHPTICRKTPTSDKQNCLNFNPK